VPDDVKVCMVYPPEDDTVPPEPLCDPRYLIITMPLEPLDPFANASHACVPAPPDPYPDDPPPLALPPPPEPPEPPDEYPPPPPPAP
jgi:hypothetical protein